MSVKHIKKYYESVCAQKDELTKLLEQFNKKTETEIVDSNVINNLKSMIAPIVDSYETLGYIMYLLNLPNNDKKIKKQSKHLAQKKKMLNESKSPESVKAENDTAINFVKSQI